MPDLLIKNNAQTKLNENLLVSLKSKCEDWQKENDFGICIFIKDSDSDEIYNFRFEKNVWEKLESGVSHNVLKGRIDVEIQKYKDALKNKIHFTFYVGFTEKEVEKLTSKDKTKDSSKNNEDNPKLSIEPVEPKFSLDKVVLPEETKTEIENVVSLLENMNKIYHEWGFVEIDPVPRSIVNFWGPPGTGKTMTVHAIAKEMGKKVLILNYADIESKYVGEAPKNLVAAFEMAEKTDAVIFFDEADSFLGKRITNVDSGSEQAINSLRSQMLMKLEEFKGIVFFATNLHENYDRAFESRILKHIEFKLPNADARKLIIKNKLPSKAPYADDVRNADGEFNEALLTKLAEIIDGFSGREIKNCVLESLVTAAKSECQEVTAEILETTFSAKKAEADAIKKKEKERKEKLSSAVKKNIDDKNYNIKKTDENGDTVIISAEDDAEKNKNENTTEVLGVENDKQQQ